MNYLKRSMKPSKRRIRRNVLAALTLSLSVLIGCSTKVHLHPIQDTDFYITDSGDICMSEYYFKEVLKAKIEETK